MSEPRFVVAADGSTEREEPTAEDRRRARILADAGGFAPDAEDLFARGIAVARSGGDVRAFLREQLDEEFTSPEQLLGGDQS